MIHTVTAKPLQLGWCPLCDHEIHDIEPRAPTNLDNKRDTAPGAFSVYATVSSHVRRKCKTLGASITVISVLPAGIPEQVADSRLRGSGCVELTVSKRYSLCVSAGITVYKKNS